MGELWRRWVELSSLRRCLGPLRFGVAVLASSSFSCSAEATESGTWSGAESELMAVDRAVATRGCT